VNDSLFTEFGKPMKTKPLDFLVIGAAKSGTTALFHYLRDHPNIYLPPEKEVSFFSNEDWFTRGWDAFVHEFFRLAPLNVLWGKVTPHYMAHPHVPERLFNMMPQIKLIALLRNPVDRAFSHYRMAIRTGAENRAFCEVVSEQLTQLNSINFLTLGEYGRILRSFFRLFPAKQLRIFFTDDLEAHPNSLVNSILTYLGLELGFSPANLGKRYHQGGMRQRFPWLIPAARRIYPIWRLWKALPENRRRVIRFWFHTRINVASEPRGQLESGLRSRLTNFYRKDVSELEHLIGREVPWKEFRR
jgi:hypothetical protein